MQQTTYAAVLPYYKRFLKKFPTVEKLAAAAESGSIVQKRPVSRRDEFYRGQNNANGQTSILIKANVPG